MCLQYAQSYALDYIMHHMMMDVHSSVANQILGKCWHRHWLCFFDTERKSHQQLSLFPLLLGKGLVGKGSVMPQKLDLLFM